LAEKQYREADKSLAKALDTDPACAEAYYLRADIYGRQKSYEKALDALSQAIELKPNYAEAYSKRGSILLKQKEYKEAKENFMKALQYKAKPSPVYYNLACIACLEKDKDDALRYLELALKNGYKNIQHIREDKDLALLRKSSQLKKLLQKYAEQESTEDGSSEEE
jgi:Tfp pilus assembly protein PilF